MQLKHLTDEEIQDYLDGNMSQDIVILVKQHLEICHRCREALKQYQNVYVSLKDDSGFELSKGFAKSVINRLPAEGEAKSYYNLLNILLAALGVIVFSVVIIRYVNLRPLAKIFSHILPGPEIGSGLLDLFEGILVALNGNLGFLALALLTFFLVAGLDRFVFQPKYRRLRT